MLQVKLKNLPPSKRCPNGSARHYYLNPDTGEYVRLYLLKRYIESLGMTEQEWYNDRILPKDSEGNPIIPRCKLTGCNEPCKFINAAVGYYEFCSPGHGRSFGKRLEGFIERFGEEEGAKAYSERSERYSYSHSIEAYVDRYGDKAEEIMKIHNESKSLSLDKFISRYGEEDGKRRYEDYRAKSSRSRSLEGYIEKYGPEEGPKMYELHARSRMSSGRVSKLSVDLFDKVTSELYGLVNLSNVHYGMDEHFKATGKRNGDINGGRYLDFTISSYKIDIEFDGDYWHPTITAEDIIEFSTGVVRDWDVLNELSREYALTKLGWKILHIKERDYRQNPEREVKKCVDFIRSIVCK